MVHDVILYIQPAYNCIDKKVEYAEVLIRRYRNIDNTAQILKFVKRHELEEVFDIDVITEVCKFIQGKELPYPIGINLCASTVGKIDIVDKITDILNEYNIKNTDIIIEINEETDFNDEKVFNNVQKMHNAGIKVALDDFGVEKANLYSLLHYKFDILKVDKSFIGHEREVSKNEILHVIRELCAKFNIKPIIEGVENKKQLNNISNMGYKIVQGYLYKKPVPLKDFKWA